MTSRRRRYSIMETSYITTMHKLKVGGEELLRNQRLYKITEMWLTNSDFLVLRLCWGVNRWKSCLVICAIPELQHLEQILACILSRYRIILPSEKWSMKVYELGGLLYWLRQSSDIRAVLFAGISECSVALGARSFPAWSQWSQVFHCPWMNLIHCPPSSEWIFIAIIGTVDTMVIWSGLH